MIDSSRHNEMAVMKYCEKDYTQSQTPVGLWFLTILLFLVLLRNKVWQDCYPQMVLITGLKLY